MARKLLDKHVMIASGSKRLCFGHDIGRAAHLAANPRAGYLSKTRLDSIGFMKPFSENLV
jgi:hypothetical protein